ncbi:periplasmic flagellar collar protein FlcA [Brachyspira hyodysenteriae]|uniref:periplasmic flagellar collar protein FlcA n=1 Tax=Brachyspira hyodysenteriae TaxID=159 RepID=UPI0022CDA4DE|nr:tetratricopeptide repeat protein [Brachyspira hyodysenteriae]MCZ9955754.1 tetratricopeptide repeat protein [Brachyspira hyodysenteriae]
MPKIEDLERLGSIAFLIGNKALPKEISQNDYDRFKSVFTDEHMASSMPAEDNGLPSIDDLDSLDFQDDSDNDKASDDLDNLDLPEDLDNALSDDIDDLGLPEDLDNNALSNDTDDLGLPEDLDNNALSNDTDDLGLPEDLDNDKVSADIDDIELPEDLEDNDKVSANIDNLELPEDLEDNDKVSANIDNLELPEDLEDNDKVSANIDNLELPEDLEDNDKVSANIDNLELPEDLEDNDKVSANIDNLELPEDLEDNDKVSANIDNLELPEDLEDNDKVSANIDNLELPEDLEDNDKVSANIDNLELPEDLEDNDKVSANIDNLELPEDLEDNDKVSANIDNLELPEDLENNDEVSNDNDDLGLPEDLHDDDLGLPEDLHDDDLGLPEDLHDDDLGLPEDLHDDDLGLPEDLHDDDLGLPEDLHDDDLGLPEDLEDNDKVSADIDSLELPEDKELEDKIAMDINDDNSSKNDIHSEKLPVLDDLPLPDTLPDIEDEKNIDNEDLPDIKSDDNYGANINDLNLDDISDSLDDILEDDDSNLDNLEDILSDDNELPSDDASEEPKDEVKEEEAKEEPQDIDLDDLSLDSITADDEEEDKTEEPKDEVKEEEAKEEPQDIDLDDLSLDSITADDEEEDKTEEPKDEVKEEEAKEEPQDIDLDDLSLDSITADDEEEDKTEEPKDEVKEEETKEEPQDIDLDDLSLDSITADDEEEDKTEEPKDEVKEEEAKEEPQDIDLDDLSLDDAVEEYEKEPKDEIKEDNYDDMDLDDLSLDDDDAIKENKNISTNIVTGQSSLPSPDSANNLPASKYDDVDKDVDHDKVINTIKYLPSLTQYHVLDAILNEKLDRISMEALLNALERGESSENITELLNKELGLSIKDEGNKNVLELIPIPNSLKDYAKIIRVAAVFLVLFVAIVVLSFQFIYKPVMANKYYEQGLLSISNGAYDDAERNFAEGERLKPKQIKWYNKYARAYIDRETFNYALKKIQGALDIKPRDFETRITFGYYYRKKGEKELSLEDYTLGEELYNDMLVYTEKKKEKETIYDERGLLMISRAKTLSEPNYYDIAYNNYRDMINFFGDGVVPRKRAMLIKIYQDDYEQVKALQNHINLLKKDYIDDEVYPKLAKYLLDKDDFYGSRILFENLITAYPNNLESIVGYADYEARLKHYDRAMEILTTAALPLYESNPFYRGKEFVYNMLGQIYYNLGEYGNAVKNFNEALTINAVYPDANYNLGNVYFYREKDYAKAKQYYQTAYDNLAPNLRSDKLLYNLSWIYYSDGEYDRAFEGFNALFQKNPSNSVVSYALGNSLLHLDKANLANGFYRNALSQVLSKRDRLGRMEMRTEGDFILLSYLASLYNNIGVSYAYNSTVTNTIVNEQEAFKYFVLASEYFDQIRTSNIDLERIEKRTILVDNQNIGAATYNIMSVQGKRNLKQATVIDDYIPKDMYYVR